MPMEHRIAAVTVLYNSQEEVHDNIRSYIDQIDLLILVDNSDAEAGDTISRIKTLKKTIYICNHGNLGLAKALNIGAQRAIAKGYKYLLTMDQDSKATPEMVNALMSCFDLCNQASVGIVAPIHYLGVEKSPRKKQSCEEILTAWTSGNILNLTAYQAVGPFCDDLFIDFVDHEYCMRLNCNGYKVFQSNNSILIHKLGVDYKVHDFGLFSLKASNHSFLRRYYITRNRFYVSNKYKRLFPGFYFRDKRSFIADVLTILLYETDKLKKLSMIIKGFVHYKKGILGRIDRPVYLKRA